MENSILKSVKKILGVDEDYTAFDLDILIHINSTFATLHQLGLGPEDGFEIEDDTTLWTAFLGTDSRLSSVKTLVYLKVRILFDPPTTGYHMDALKEQIKELEWRLNSYREETAWTDPDPDPMFDSVVDGGNP